MRLALFAIAALACSTPASADVVQATPAGFEISQTITIDAAPDAVWDVLRSPQKWWDKEHTYSGDSANLYLDAQATGCFCEKLPGKGSVEHGHVVYVEPGRALRLHAALGPLQAEGVTGALTLTLQRQGEQATVVKLSYVVGGFVRGGAEAMATKVDAVLAVQLAHLKAAAEAPAP
ncbi:SRPBCC family protein [Sphingomonas sp.]|uniref:SRPBCC family protein n=1 Tax=Sphingomonas sp. TaxID=28214 RepID=UPI001DB83E47|nr:SRPBCC family protein [Sphingomonas sp.]MBX9797614.1 SRPBCC family protein [Sphingomonas sp.]